MKRLFLFILFTLTYAAWLYILRLNYRYMLKLEMRKI